MKKSNPAYPTQGSSNRIPSISHPFPFPPTASTVRRIPHLGCDLCWFATPLHKPEKRVNGYHASRFICEPTMAIVDSSVAVAAIYRDGKGGYGRSQTADWRGGLWTQSCLPDNQLVYPISSGGRRIDSVGLGISIPGVFYLLHYSSIPFL